jgi:UPF0271 protein
MLTMGRFFAYMLRCSDGSFYTGHTDDLETRMAEHIAGIRDAYVAQRRPVELVWSCDFATRIEALERERQIKGWSREKKLALIAGDWDRLHVLARRRGRPSTAASPKLSASAQDERTEPIERIPLGESALRITLPARCSRRALLDALRATVNVVDVVVTDTHAAVYFDPSRPIPDVAPALALASTARDDNLVREHIIRVAYDGPDLDDVARDTRLTRAEVIAIHTRPIYTVAFVGFMPGFAYLDGLDERLRLPRRAVPRTRVPTGSVAIAGARSGIYPFASPGGWHLLGRVVDFVAFDVERGATLNTGDRIRFEPA